LSISNGIDSCAFYNTVIDIFGDHCINCKGRNGALVHLHGVSNVSNRHSVLRDNIHLHATSANIDASIEFHEFGTDRDKRPGDIVLHNFDDGVDLRIDVGVCNLLSPSYISDALRSDDIHRVSKRVADEKMSYYRRNCSAELRFSPAIVAVTGGWEPYGLAILNRIVSHLHTEKNLSMPDAKLKVFGDLNVKLISYLGRMLSERLGVVRRLPLVAHYQD
jgi:hypothetical protein